jgi:hypothetical protein
LRGSKSASIRWWSEYSGSKNAWNGQTEKDSAGVLFSSRQQACRIGLLNWLGSQK